MPEPTVVPSAADIAANNAAVAAKLAAQDASGQSTAPNADLTPALEALDKMAADINTKKQAEADAAAAKVAAAAEDPAAKAAAEAKAKADAEAAAAAAAPDPHAKRAEEFFKDSPGLPPNASPKSAESFQAIKVQAAKEISRLEQELATAKAAAEEAKKSLAQPSPEQQQREKELQELRDWRARVDVEFDPKFKQFDKTINESREFVYSLLRKSPAINEATIEKIKSFGGPDKINLVTLFESIKDPSLQKLVEAQVSEIFKADYQKEQAITAAKTNITQYRTERETAFTQAVGAHNTETRNHLNHFLSQLEWLKPKAADAPDHKEYNAFVEKLKSEVDAAAQDDSPQMRATLIAGFAQLVNIQRVHEAVKKENATLTEQVKTLSEKLEKIKNASRSRLSDTNAPANGIPAPVKPADSHTRTEDALDAIARQVTEARAARNT